MKDMLVVVPSRGRPDSIRRLAETMERTCRGDTTLVVGLDDDDPAFLGYCKVAQSIEIPDIEVCADLRQVVAWLNALAVPRAGQYRYTGHVGDDNVFSTDGWDVQMMEALEKTPFAFGNDLYPSRPPGTLCCHVFCRSEVIRALGYFGPPSIRHMYVDVAWMAWGTACGITFLPDVVIEHLHYTTGKSPMDASNQASLACTGPDLLAWHEYSRGGQLNADIAKLGGREFTRERLLAFNRDLLIPEL